MAASEAKALAIAAYAGDRMRSRCGRQRSLLSHACSSSQLVTARVAPLLAEQKNADHAGAVLRFVLLA